MIGEVAVVVAEALERAGIRAVLTGGACASLYSAGAYQSHDLDFIVEGAGRKAALDAAMASVGFARQGDRYVHPRSKLFVEFPTGPLAVGNDMNIEPVALPLGPGQAWALSPTDACRDRLAAFYHWSDRQSLQVAVQIAQRHDVQMSAIRTWSDQEGAAESRRVGLGTEFLDAVDATLRRVVDFSRAGALVPGAPRDLPVKRRAVTRSHKTQADRFVDRCFLASSTNIRSARFTDTCLCR